MNNTVTLYKLSQRSLDESVIRKQLDYGISRALGGSRKKVWACSGPRLARKLQEDGEYLYSAVVAFRRTGKAIPGSLAESQIERMKGFLETAVRGKGWTLNGESPKQIQEPNKAEGQPEAPRSSYADVISIEKGNHFSHLYNLDSQIELVLSAVEEYTRSSFANRFHCVLYGEPACGKTEILRSLTRMLGKDAVMHFDATSTTSAGAKQLLTESAAIPPVLCIEEIEKADEVSLRWLLGVLDYRAEVRALKYRAGLISKEVKLLCLATVNDFGLFNKMMDGALASRFSHKIYCPRPTRLVLDQILQREVTRAGGNPKWITPALDYCINQEGTNDPRRIITVCLCGRDRLLNGEYQKLLAATRPSVKEIIAKS